MASKFAADEQLASITSSAVNESMKPDTTSPRSCTTDTRHTGTLSSPSNIEAPRIREGSESITEKGSQADTPPSGERMALDWEGPNDPEDPTNWPLLQRVNVIVGASLLGFSITAASSIISPGVFDIQSDFGVSRTAAMVPLSVYVLGLALGPALGAPISETQGRSVVYKLSGLLCMLFSLGAGFSETFAGLVVCRLFAGLFGGPVLAIAAGTVADLVPAHKRAVSAAGFVMGPFLGPCFGPVVGGFAAQYKGWEWTQWCAIFLILPGFLMCTIAGETYKKIILKTRAKRLNIAGPPAPPVQGAAALKMLFTITLARPTRMLFTEPIVIAFALYNGFTFAVLFCMFAAFPYVFQGVYGFEIYEYGLTFLSIGVGVLFATIAMIIVDRVMYMPRYHQALKDGRSVVAPEHRLYIGMLGSPMVPIGLFWFAWTARADIHWICPVLAGIPFAFGNLCVFYAAAVYLVDTYGPLNGASAMAANGIVRYILGGAFPLFTVQMYERLGTDWATSLLGFVSLVLLPIPWVLFSWGPKLRALSQYECLKD